MKIRHQIRNMGRDLGIRRLETVEESRSVKGLAAGLLGGLAASWVMTQFQSAWSKASQALSKRRGQAQESGQEQHEQSESGEEPATVAVATAISTKVAHRPLTQHQKQIAGPMVHYAYGTLIGGLYGVLAENMPLVTLGSGTAYGAAAWLLGDEVMVPLLGISKPPTQYPLSTHAYALVSHLVYGATLDLARRAAGRVI